MKVFLFFLTLISYLSANEIKFSTMLQDRTSNIELEFKNMMSYLQKETSSKFSFVFNTDYDDLVNKFGEQKIDIVALNAIEYVKLKRFFPYANLIIGFYDKNRSKFYTCDAVTKNQKIKSIKDIDKNISLRLLDSNSTCGFGNVKYILEKNGLKMQDFKSRQLGIDDDIILEVLLNPKDVGFEKSSTIEKYDFFDLNIIKTDFKTPTIALVVNKHTVSDEIIQAIQNALLKLNPKDNLDDYNLVKNWNFSTKHGSFIPDEKEYLHLYNILYKTENHKDKR